MTGTSIETSQSRKRSRDGVADALLDLKKAKTDADVEANENGAKCQAELRPPSPATSTGRSQAPPKFTDEDFRHAVDAAVAQTAQVCASQLLNSVQQSPVNKFSSRCATLVIRIQTLNNLESVLKREVNRMLDESRKKCVFTTAEQTAYDVSLLTKIRSEIQRSGPKAVASMLKLMACVFDSITEGTSLGNTLGPIEHSFSTIFTRLRASLKHSKDSRPQASVSSPPSRPLSTVSNLSSGQVPNVHFSVLNQMTSSPPLPHQYFQPPSRGSSPVPQFGAPYPVLPLQASGLNLEALYMFGMNFPGVQTHQQLKSGFSTPVGTSTPIAASISPQMRSQVAPPTLRI